MLSTIGYDFRKQILKVVYDNCRYHFAAPASEYQDFLAIPPESYAVKMQDLKIRYSWKVVS